MVWQEYHGDGDGDVDGLLRKIGNTGVTDVNDGWLVTRGGKQRALRLQGQGEG